MYSVFEIFNLKFLLIMLSAGFALTGCAATSLNCINGWKVTGYYTPMESDFSAQPAQTILLKNGNKYQYSKDFLDAVTIEGWGKTRYGWYLGRYGQQWHRNETPLDARGKQLRIGSIATDPQLISPGTRVVMPAMKPHIDQHSYTATDVGSAIQGKHIDVYTGEGMAAKKLSWKVTGDNQQVCL